MIPYLMNHGDRSSDIVLSLAELIRESRTTSRELEQRIIRLKEDDKDDTLATQTLYHQFVPRQTLYVLISGH